MATESRLPFAQMVGNIDLEQLTESQRATFFVWHTAVYALADIADARALTEFREAAIWGAHHEDQQLVEYGVRGMGKVPRGENIPYFAEIFSALPRATEGIGSFAAYYALLALIDHRHSDALPIFCTQLDHPDDYNRRQAHRGLVELIGRDLGTTPAPWLEYYAQQRRQRP